MAPEEYPTANQFETAETDLQVDNTEEDVFAQVFHLRSYHLNAHRGDDRLLCSLYQMASNVFNFLSLHVSDAR